MNDLPDTMDIIKTALDMPEFLAGALIFASILAHFYNIFVFFQKFSSGRTLGELFGAFSIFQLVLFFYVVYKLKVFLDSLDFRITSYIDNTTLWILAAHFLINFVYICFYAKEILNGNDLKKPSDSVFEPQNHENQTGAGYRQNPAGEFPQTDRSPQTREYASAKPTYDFSSAKPAASASPAGSTSPRLKTSIPSSKLSKIRISTDSAGAPDDNPYASEHTAGSDGSMFASDEEYLNVLNGQISEISEYFRDMESSRQMNENLLKSAGSGSRKSLDRLFAESNGLWICNYCDTMNSGERNVCIVCRKSR